MLFKQNIELIFLNLGRTGLMYAACDYNNDYNKLGLRMFIKHGANVDAKDNKGKLHLALHLS